MVTDEVTQVDSPPLIGLHEKYSFGTSSGPPPLRGVQTNSGKSLVVFKICIGWDSEFYLAVEQVTCPLPLKNIQGGQHRWNIWGTPTHGLDTEWGSVERYQEIPTRSKDTGWEAAWKMPRNTHPVERYGAGAGGSTENNGGIPRAQLKDAKVTSMFNVGV